jgi:hypothetical protein
MMFSVRIPRRKRAAALDNKQEGSQNEKVRFVFVIHAVGFVVFNNTSQSDSYPC